MPLPPRSLALSTALTLCLAIFAVSSVGAEHVHRAADDAAASTPHTHSTRVSSHQARLAADPRNADLAAETARIHLADFRADGDHHHLDLAHSALAAWWTTVEPPTEILVLRAIVRQANHAFDGALIDLDHALRRESRNVQALLSRSFVLQTLGRLDEARDDCRRLPNRIAIVLAATCLSRVDSLTGNVDRAERRLSRVTARIAIAEPALRSWVLVNQAEIARRRGDDAAAEQRFRAASSAGVSNSYGTLAYADLLLDQGRGADALDVVTNVAPGNASLLRVALAKRQIGAVDADDVVASLAKRFATADDRAGAPDLREQARFFLEFTNAPHRALQLALLNWQTQREPADAKLILAAAIAADHPQAAAPALAWIADVGLEDPQLNALIDQIEARNHRASTDRRG